MRFVNPPRSRIIDVRDYGAVSGQDCSAAFQNAYLAANLASGRFSNPTIIYVPDGEWLLSYPVLSRLGSADAWTNPTLSAIGKVTLHDGWRAGMIFQGQSTENTIIRVPANSPGFQDAANPRGVFITGSEAGASTNRNPNPQGGGNIAFRHGIYGLTILIEAGNPGAIGLDMVVTNRGGASNLKIIDLGGSAKYGLSFHRVGSGPAYYKNIFVEGFEYAVFQSGLNNEQRSDYHLTFEKLTIRNQKIAGIRINGMPICFRGITSYNNVPVLTNGSKRSNVSITSSTFFPNEIISKGAIAGRVPSTPIADTAIKSDLGELYLRNITNNAYQRTYEDKSITPSRIGTGNIVEYSTRLTAFASPTAPSKLDLPVLDAPEFNSVDLADYANVEDYGANGLSSADSWAAIQEAIDSGKKIVYLPNGVYWISQPLILRNNCVKLVGMTARIQRLVGFTDYPIIIRDGTHPFVCLEHLWVDGILHDCQRTLVLRHANCRLLNDPTGVLATSPNAIGGRTFVEDVMAIINSDYPHDFWLRQYDPEFAVYNLKVTGGTCWVSGAKMETDSDFGTYSTNILARQGARLQIDSMHIYPLKDIPKNIAAIEIDEAKAQINFRIGTGTFGTVIKEKRNGVTRTMNVFNTSLFRSQA